MYVYVYIHTYVHVHVQGTTYNVLHVRTIPLILKAMQLSGFARMHMNGYKYMHM